MAATWGFSGAEIEKVVKSALEATFVAGRDLTAEGLLTYARRSVPISRTMAQQINNLRTWAQDRAIPAGEPLEAQPKLAGKRRAGIEM